MANRLAPTDTLDPDFLQSVVRQATYQCRAEGSGFYLCDPIQGRISLVATHNMKQIPWDEGLPDRVIAGREALFEVCYDRAVSLAVPLIWQDAVRGVLVVFDVNLRRTFRDRDTALLQYLADMTASVAQQNE